MSKKIKLTIEFEVENGTSDHEIAEWVEFETGQNGSISLSNYLHKKELKDLDDDFKSNFKLEIDGKNIRM